MTTEKYTLPKALDVEELVLGAMMVDSNGPIEAIPILKEVDVFFSFEHQAIYRAILALYNNNRPIDLVTVTTELKKTKKYHNITNDVYVISLAQKIASAAHIEYHCRILLQMWIKRRIIQKCKELTMFALDETYDSLDLLDKDAATSQFIEETISEGAKHMNYKEALKLVEKRTEIISNLNEGELTGVPTGYKKVDDFTGGWQPSDLIILAARPGMGKTSFVLKTAVSCGSQDIAVGIFSLEMGSQQLATRTVAINSNLHLTQLLRDGLDKPKYFVNLRDCVNTMGQYPIHIDDTAGIDIRSLMSKARIWKRKHDIKLLIVDYLQLLTDRAAPKNREQEISSISRKLKQLAKELKIPVIALSQLSRTVETRGGDKRPRLADLRESGAIEQDADIVTFLYRPEYYNIEVPDALLKMDANAELIFAKYRNGSLGMKALKWIGDKTKYVDPAELEINNDDETTVFDAD